MKQAEKYGWQTCDLINRNINVFLRLSDAEATQRWNSKQRFHPAEIILGIVSFSVAKADVHYRVLVQFHSLWFP